MIFAPPNKTSADDELLSRGVYDEIFQKLHLKVKSGLAIPSSYVIYPELTLSWVLSHKNQLIEIILDEIQKPDFSFDTIKHSIIVTDKARDIYIAAWPERILMLALGQILTARLSQLIPKNVYSFQKGRGPHEAVRDATNYIQQQKARPLYVLKRDVSKYGDSIPQPKLFAALEIATDITSSPIFFKLLKAAIRVPFRSPKDSAEASLCVGVPSGSPLVPPLENFYLTPLDRKLAAIENSFYGRYGDDIIFITSDKSLADWARNEIATTVSNLGLEIKPQKMVNARLNFTKHSINDEYEHKTHLPWLGFSLTNQGTMGIKQKHLDLVLGTLKKEISGLFYRAKMADIGFTNQMEVIKHGLRLLLRKNSPRALSAYIYYHNDKVTYKLIDKRVTELVLHHLIQEFRLSKKSAWAQLRALKKPSTYYLKFIDGKPQRRTNRRKAGSKISTPQPKGRMAA